MKNKHTVRQFFHWTRVITVVLAICLVAIALTVDLGGGGIGYVQLMIVLAGVVVGLTCLLPLEWNKKILLLVASGAVSLILVECVYQIMLGPYLSTLYKIDERFLHTHIPNTTNIFRHSPVNGGHTITMKTNSLGYRGEELSDSRPAIRVLLYGDSFISGEFSELDKTFAEQLEANLTSIVSADVEVVNAGVVAYGPDQISLRMETELVELAPDLVVVSIYAANDFGDLVRNKIYRLGSNGELLRNNFLISNAIRSSFRVAAQGPILYKMSLRMLRRFNYFASLPTDEGKLLAFKQAQMEQWLGYQIEAYREYVIEGNNEVKNLLGDYYDADVSLIPSSESATYKRRLMEQVLVRMQRIADEHAVPLVLVLIPAAVDVCNTIDLVAVDKEKYPEYLRSTLTDSVAAMAEDHRIIYCNLFETFRNNNPNHLYFREDDEHWNDEGQALAAREVTDYLISLGLVKN